jgi:hypothetical protein
MKNLTKRQLEDYDNCRIKPPAEYQDMDTEQRRAFVLQEIESGKHPVEESLSIHDILHFSGQTGSESPEYFLYRIILERKDPSEVEQHLKEDLDYMLFFELYGIESAKTHLKSSRLLDLHHLIDYYGDDIYVSAKDIELMLHERGCEAVAVEVTNKKLCESYVEIFGLNAIKYVQKNVANKFKGDLLEESLGL